MIDILLVKVGHGLKGRFVLAGRGGGYAIQENPFTNLCRYSMGSKQEETLGCINTFTIPSGYKV